MILILLTDLDGNPLWVNPDRIMMLSEVKTGRTDLQFGDNYTSLSVKQSAEVIYSMIRAEQADSP